MKTKYFRITESGELAQVQTPMFAHVAAANMTEAKAKLMRFARLAIDEPPVLRKSGDATQLAYWGMFSIPTIQVQAGWGNRTDLCIAGFQGGSLDEVRETDASFAYYATQND